MRIEPGRRSLTDEQRLMLGSVDRLMEKYDEAYWGRLDKEGAYPDEFVDAMEGEGLGAVPVSKEYGGPGLGVFDASLILEEINAMGGNSQPFHGQYYLLFALSKFASQKMKDEYLPKIAGWELRLQSLALTEPEAGSESTKIKTSAERGGPLPGQRAQNVHLQDRELRPDGPGRQDHPLR